LPKRDLANYSLPTLSLLSCSEKFNTRVKISTCSRASCVLVRGPAQPFTQDSPHRSRSQKCRAKRFAGFKGIRDFQDARLSAISIRFRKLVLVCVQEELPSRGIRLPGNYGNLEFLRNRERLLNIFPGALPIAFSHRNAGLQIPAQNQQM